MRRLDILKWILLAGVLYTYWKGYLCFTSGKREMGVAWALGCAVLFCLWLQRLGRLYYLHMRMSRVDRLSGRSFEKYLEVHFRHMGYRVKLTSYSHDFGADLIVKKRGEKIVVQAKRYAKNVGISAVQEAVGSVAYYGADRAMVVTNSGFTKSARDLARQNEVELWGRQEIRDKFHIVD